MTKENKEKLEELQYYVGNIDGDTVFSKIQEVLDNDGEEEDELYCAMQELEEIKDNTNKAIKILENLEEN